MKPNFDQVISSVVRNLPPSGIRRFFDLVASTKGVISLGVGEPDFVTPWHIREKCIYSLEKGHTMYTSNHGMLELREGIAQYLNEQYQVKYKPESEIIVTIGASEAVDIALRAIINPGDEVLIPEPCFVSYKPCTVLAGGVPVTINTNASNGFKVTPQQLESHITNKTKALIICYPNNPTGAVMSKDDLFAIAKIVNKHNLIVISDEIYSELNYQGQHTSFASLPEMRDRTILLNGFSKSFAMTGWRIGYVCAHEELVAAMVKIHQYSIMCASIMAQEAAIEALKNGRPHVDDMVNQYNYRRRLVVAKLNEIGLECFEPKGAFYAFPSIKITGLSEVEFAEKLLEEEKVAVIPGTAFGECGKGHIRISYAASIQNISEALHRIGSFVQRNSNKIPALYSI
ncbi:aminotransferase class I/II-fold pyridoxal phosphate-dependent enzyme [Bacillota bacterium LX-D]|nr:aminotransferase class I/II-fold pyridoxal phosphate-dependent enzyme [Bacillota bacterium LX-D]